MKLSKTTVTSALVIALAMLATPAVVLVPSIGARTVVPCRGNNRNAPKVYVPGPHDRSALGPYYRGAAPRPYYTPRSAARSPMLQRRVVP